MRRRSWRARRRPTRDDRIIYNARAAQLFYDADGDGAAAAMLFATLSARADPHRRRLHGDLRAASAGGGEAACLIR